MKRLLVAMCMLFACVVHADTFEKELGPVEVKPYLDRDELGTVQIPFITWGGDLPVATAKAISQQLFKGNDYWFTMGTDIKGATISVHIYDREGNLVEQNAWQRDGFAGAAIKPTKTGSYFLIVKVEKSSRERTPWGLVYAYR